MEIAEMRICGVISEFNPFHNGHKYLLSEIRKMGYDAIICVMSGNFVQRGEYAVCDKKIRAKCACDGGADLVISLPFPWSSATAEQFALGAVSILDKLGCAEAIAFGSECGDISSILECAKVLNSIGTSQILNAQKINPKDSYANIRQKLVSEMTNAEIARILESPNDILAVEYCKAILGIGSEIRPICVKRIHSSHKGDVFGNDISSSSFIRKLASDGNFDEAEKYYPCSDFKLSESFMKVDCKAYFNLLTGAVLSSSPQDLAEISDIGGGFEFAIYRELLTAKSYDELFDSLRSRHLTDAKIRRALLFAALGVRKKVFGNLPEYTEVLAMGDRGKSILASLRNNERITVLSKIGNIKQAPDIAKEQFKLQRKSEIIFEKIII